MPPLRELKISSISDEDKAYLLGLYLTDGCAYAWKDGEVLRNYWVAFFLQGDQEEVAEKVMRTLERLGLNPRIDVALSLRSNRNMISVVVWSKALYEFLPQKKALLGDAALRERFFRVNGFFRVKDGIPFLAGLLDGDGSCRVHVDRKSCFLGGVKKWGWYLGQCKKNVYLVEYTKKFVCSLASDENAVKLLHICNGAIYASFCKSGVLTVLRSGIERYSWKAARWSEKVAEVQRERGKYLTVGQAAKLLGLSYCVMWSRIREGVLHYSRSTMKTRKSAQVLTNYYIPADEVKEFKERLEEERLGIERIKNSGIKLSVAARILRLTSRTLASWCRTGKIRGLLLREGSRRYWVIPKDEIEKAKRRV
jgi:hypothetical protein